ncbi:MAG TPA: N-acetylglucosamine-6-phosphate deacetylase [Solirubrobacteraceae bacterium]|nr:N-acetylglucosamine-6-phosphate deacetylase [Solirubrobacteraceae bacterium]
MRLRSERIVCPDGTLAGEVVVDDGRIASVVPLPSGAGARAARRDGELVELGDRWLVPGYIDVHVHGGGGAQCNTSHAEEIAEVAHFHARHGTTGLLATTVAAPMEQLCDAVAAIVRCEAPTLLGAHLEGPFLSREQPGAMDRGTFLEPDLDQLDRLLAAGAGAIRLMTLAPELPGALELVQQLGRAGVIASIGHTNATDAEVREAARAGASAATHLCNAMPPFHHRRPGPVGAVLDLQEVSCELICDGVHVDPVALRLFFRAKGALGIRLITDAIAAAGMPDGDYRLGGRSVTVTGGRAVLAGGDAIAGSTLTMETAVQNAVRFLGITIEQAVLISSTNSARLLGLDRHKGAISVGLDADLLVLDELLAVEATMVAGRWIAGPP